MQSKPLTSLGALSRGDTRSKRGCSTFPAKRQPFAFGTARLAVRKDETDKGTCSASGRVSFANGVAMIRRSSISGLKHA